VSRRRSESLLEGLREARDLALAETARSAVLAGAKRLETAGFVLATELPQPLRRHVERLGEPAQMTLRIRRQLNEDRVPLELLARLEGPDHRATDEDLGRRAADDDAAARREPLRDRQSLRAREVERLRPGHARRGKMPPSRST
jgi:hypothetical protein